METTTTCDVWFERHRTGWDAGVVFLFDDRGRFFAQFDTGKARTFRDVGWRR